MPLKRILFLLLIILLAGKYNLQAQQLEGIWSGKISRNTDAYGGVESVEVQLFQSGKDLWGYSFIFKDTSRFVLYRLNGSRSKKKEKTVMLQETGYPFFVLPDGFFPCEKFFKLVYNKIGKTQYLSGTWGGRGSEADTTCFPGEQLLVVLQKLKTPDYPLELFAKQKIINYFIKRRDFKKPDEKTVDIAAYEEKAIPEIIPLKDDSSLTERKLDIQQILSVKDSVMHINLYDNAEIDDDTVSLFVNKKPVLVKQRISDKALIFDIKLPEPGKPVEILMQAENLGSIPPNTALMVIECGNKRYEVRLTSGYEKHAVIIVTREPD